jgi:hypothetical protein
MDLDQKIELMTDHATDAYRARAKEAFRVLSLSMDLEVAAELVGVRPVTIENDDVSAALPPSRHPANGVDDPGAVTPKRKRRPIAANAKKPAKRPKTAKSAKPATGSVRPSAAAAGDWIRAGEIRKRLAGLGHHLSAFALRNVIAGCGDAIILSGEGAARKYAPGAVEVVADKIAARRARADAVIDADDRAAGTPAAAKPAPKRKAKGAKLADLDAWLRGQGDGAAITNAAISAAGFTIGLFDRWLDLNWESAEIVQAGGRGPGKGRIVRLKLGKEPAPEGEPERDTGSEEGEEGEGNANPGFVPPPRLPAPAGTETVSAWGAQRGAQ